MHNISHVHVRVDVPNQSIMYLHALSNLCILDTWDPKTKTPVLITEASLLHRFIHICIAMGPQLVIEVSLFHNNRFDCT